MAGTREGGLKAAQTNKERHGDTFYVGIGAAGGKKSRGGGFASMEPAKLKESGRKGGRKSKRPKMVKPEPKGGVTSWWKRILFGDKES